MRLRTAVLALASTGILLTGCGGSTTVESQPTADESASKTPSPTPSESKSDKSPGMPPATPPDDPNWKPQIPIESVKGDPENRTVVVNYTLPTPCSPGLRKADVTERADSVTIKLLRKMPQSADDKLVCTQVIQEKSVDVQLQRPLKGRTVVDGSSGKVVKVTS